jgi:hypothetical protein
MATFPEAQLPADCNSPVLGEGACPASPPAVGGEVIWLLQTETASNLLASNLLAVVPYHIFTYLLLETLFLLEKN